ncbi:MAG: hypothetical protein ACFFC9_08060, partial [Promethearchaeota archaeon]
MKKKLSFGILLLFFLIGTHGFMVFSINSIQLAITPQSSGISDDFMIELLEDKSLLYGQQGYFPKVYEPSIQATYYGLYILNTIGRLDLVHKPTIRDFIMSFYDNETHLFWDSYAYRATDLTIFERPYPLASLLEINCYAILSLEILGYIHLIDSSRMIEFVMNCINSTSSGFIGQEYDPNLYSFEKIATMDNTFFAIQIIDILADWSSYPNLRNNLVAFISGLQEKNGGFFNDQVKAFSSLGYNEPNMASSYYCITSLKMLNDLTGFNNNTFESFMLELYNNESQYFRFYSASDNEYNIIATAMGMEIAKIMDFKNVSINGCLTFLKDMRNNYGIWGSTTSVNRYELIDSFQVIRAIAAVEMISIFSYHDQSTIASTIINLFYNRGFSLISEQYSSAQTIYTLINSYYLYNCVLELLPIGYINTILTDLYKYYSYSDYHTFLACCGLESERNLRSMPIE